jgi:hypothetical protein
VSRSRAQSRLRPLVENIGESTTACLVTMVQGNLFALSLGHWLIASRTGLVAGVVATAALLLARAESRWVVSAALGVVTAVVDYFVHPGQFGPIVMEAIVTGLAASLLSLLVGAVVRRWPRRSSARS